MKRRLGSSVTAFFAILGQRGFGPGWVRAALLGLAVVFVAAEPAAAAAGSFDSTFNRTGRVIVRKGDTTTVELQARGANAGKIVVGTTSGLVRFTTGGGIDSTFANAGVASTPGVVDMAVQANDDYLLTVHGGATAGLTVRRFTSSGGPDRTFDGDGSARVSVPGFSDGHATAVAAAPGGRIIVAGYAEKRTPACVPVFGNPCVTLWNTLVVRLHPTGAIDTSFGVNGIAFLPDNAAHALPVDVAVRTDGAVVVVGNFSGISTPNGYANTTVVSQLRPDGRPDAAFGTVGETTFGPSTAVSAQFDNDGRLLVAGTSDGDQYAMTLTRLLPGGAIDTRFGTNGVARWAASCGGFSCSGGAAVVVVPPSRPGGGRLLVAGWKDVNSFQNLAVAAFEYESGRVDVRFGNAGAVIPGPQVSRANAAVLTSDGKLVVAGGRYAGDILLYRFLLQ